MSTSFITTARTAEAVKADLERRRCNMAVPHKDRRREAKRGGGKGGRQGARRAACAY